MLASKVGAGLRAARLKFRNTKTDLGSAVLNQILTLLTTSAFDQMEK
jgi:hypothetical protein